jgi:polar amino acid transport system substrate-binding protein
MLIPHMRKAYPARRATKVWWLLLALCVFLPLMAACGGETEVAGSTQTSSGFDEVKERGVLRAGIRFDNPPHSFINEEGDWVGFDVDIAEALAREMGVKLERVKVDELTRISYLQEGKIDVAVASMSHTIEREEEIDFSQTYFWSHQTFLVKKGKIGSLHGLVGKKVGMDRGSSAIGNWQVWLKTHGYPDDPQITEFGDKRAAVQAVKQGSIAGWAEDYEILASYAKGDPSLTVLSGEGIGVKLDGIGVPENDSKLRDEVNYALQRIETSGEYDRIYDRWFGPESDTPVPREGRIEVWPNG